MSNTQMLRGFASYVEPELSPEQRTIGMPHGTRAKQLVRLPNGWRLWLHTADFIYGTYLELYDTGEVLLFTAREDEGDDMIFVRPTDHDIRGRQ